MLLELALLAGAATLGRKVARRARGDRRRPMPVVPEPVEDATPPSIPHRAEIGASAGALVLAGAGQALRSTPLAAASVPLTLWSTRRQFSDAGRNLWVDRRLGFAVVESGVTIFGVFSGAVTLAAGSAVLHALALSLEAREKHRNRLATRRPPQVPPDVWLGPRGPAVPADGSLVGATIEVRPGSTIPIDGRVVDGRLRVDGRLVDGAVAPRDLGPGDAVRDGQRVTGGAARVQIEAAGAMTSRHRRAATHRRAAPTLEPSARRADRIADASVGFTVPTAAIAGLVGGSSTVVAVLGSNLFSAHRVAAPLALQQHLDALGDASIQVPDGRAFELLAIVDRLCIDLNALLDPVRLTLDAVLGAEGFDGGQCLAWAAAALSGTDDPVADALAEALALRARDLPEALGRAVEADGVTAWIDGRRVEVGSSAALEARGVRLDPHLERRRDPTGGWITLGVAIDGRQAALLRLEAAARPGAAGLFEGLARLGITPLLMSADRPEVGERWARRLGAPGCWSELDGQARTTVIESLRSGGHALGYLGAGAVDLPGMMLCDVTLAVDPTDPDVYAATDIVLRGQPLSRVPAVIEFARHYHRGQGRAIALLALATGTVGFMTLAFGLGPVAALASQALGLGAGIAAGAPDPDALEPLPTIEPGADAPTPETAGPTPASSWITVTA